jgi:predicted membrane chloride channel (bestrophin family)
MLWNMLTAGYTDLTGIDHPPVLSSQYTPPLTLPMNPFTLSSSFLGLLLVFRTNKAYQRWDEARKNWGMNMYV